MRDLKRVLLFGMGTALAGCGGGGGGNQMAATVSGTLVGEIMLTGSAPAIQVTLVSESSSVDLVGEWRSELENLAGAEVAVRGKPTGQPREFQVSSYEIRSIAGERPLVGTLAERDGELWLDGNESVRLVSAPAGLRNQLGAKVWVLGRRMEGGVHPQTYGVIRASRE
ncbi:MAG: hypothetical protein IID06_05215 [Gemmatimonadetes bacterium]|nr:hypothetical protein [Gemmatimonadota bacterium]